MHFGRNYQPNLMKFYFSNLIELENCIKEIKENFDNSDSIRSEGNVNLSIRTKLKFSMKSLTDKVDPLKRKF
jgi:hypothetical protein